MKTKKSNILIVTGLIGFIAVTLGCKKAAFLDTRPSSNLVVPSSLSDFQALLDHSVNMSETPALGETSADNYFVSSYSVFQTMQIKDQNTYVWAKDIFQGVGGDADWNESYQNILYCNVILDGIGSIPRNSSNASNWDNVRGEALFTRAYEFFNLAQVFAPVYDAATAGTDLGVPLRLTSDVNAQTTRATVAQTYNQIIGDVILSKSLLPAIVSGTYRNRASKPAAYAFLARIYLSMRDYNNAQLYADSCLQLYNTLMDYNQNANTTTTPFTNLNTETIYQSNIYSGEQVLFNLRFQNAGFSVDTTLYRSYDPNDLRSYFYFVPKSAISIFTKGTYSGSTPFFSGFATDEVYLIRAECEARKNNLSAAMTDLNTLLVKRWKTGYFTPYTAATSQQALNIILTERRKELLIRGTRWTDLRRLNKEGANITLTRLLNGTTYTLPPNSSDWTLPIPPDVISITGIQQNNR